MEKIFLLLRQRKLLYILQHQNGLITGAELAKQLEATSRTIRSDVAAINRSLEPYHIKIDSFRSKGYQLTAEDSAVVRQLLQAETAFLTKEDRLRYLTFQICLSDAPIPTDELEDEMFISHGTLENDLQNLMEKTLMNGDKIRLTMQNGRISLEQDERKRRMMLCKLYYEHWNYNEHSNAFYEYDFLDESRLNRIITLVTRILHRNNIRMEDSNIVNLNLACAIMLERVASGYALSPAPSIQKSDPASKRAAEELTEALKNQFNCELPEQEQDELYTIISSGKLRYSDAFTYKSAKKTYEPLILDMANAYLDSLSSSFGLDFSKDEDFYITLLQFIYYLQSPIRIFNSAENPEIVKRMLLVELELAWQFQRISYAYTRKYLTEAELLALAECMSGALEFLLHHRPEVKIRTVICCHLSLSVAWAIKRKILSRFSMDLSVSDIIPVNAKAAFDFKETDLILSTVHKPIVEDGSVDTIEISSLVTPKDVQVIEGYIKQNQIRKIFPYHSRELDTLLTSAWWFEDMEFQDVFQAAQFSVKAFVEGGIAGIGFEEDIQRRLRLKFHALEPGIVFLPSAEPASKTQLSIVLLKHRVLLKKCKIRAIITASFCPGERALIFKLTSFFHQKNQSVKSFGEFRSKNDFLSLFSKNS